MSQSPHPRLDELLELRHQAHAIGIASSHMVNSAFSGVYASVFRGQGLHFEEVREYREGDDIRNMDWKVTARTNEPHLKIYREERERSVVLCIDCGPHMQFGTRSTFKSQQAARATALIGWAANSQQDRVGGMLFGDADRAVQYFQPTKDRRALWRLLHELSNPAQRAQRGTDSLQQALQQVNRGSGRGAVVVIIADFNRDISQLETAMGQLAQRHSVVLIPVDDAADYSLPAMGRIRFRNSAGKQIEIDTDSDAGRNSYRKSWQERRTNLQAMANRLGVALIAITTADDVHTTLMHGLRQRAHMRQFL